MTNWWKKICVTRPWRVIGAAVLVVAVMGWYGMGIFGDIKTSDQFTANNTESMRAKTAIEAAFGTTPSTDIVLFERRDTSLGQADGAAYQKEVARLLTALNGRVNSIKTYATTGADALISKDKTMTYALVEGKGTEAEIYGVLRDFAAAADQSKLGVVIGGMSVVSQQMNETVGHDLARTEAITFPVLLVLLVLFFGSAVAALVPLGISAVTIAGAFALARLLTHVVSIDQYAVNVITILGIGLAIDYALLSINRFREELHAHGSVERAVRLVIDTSGRTVFFSGITVVACMLSLLVFPLDFLHSIAIGGSTAVVVAMLFTVLVLPAILRVIGKRIDAWHLPFKRRHVGSSRFWTRVAAVTTSHPVLSAAGAAVVIMLAVLPISQFKMSGAMDYHYIADGSSGRVVMQRLQNDFSQQSLALTGVVALPSGVSTAEAIETSCLLTSQINRIAHVSAVVSPTTLSDGVDCTTFKMLWQSGQLPPLLQSFYSDNLRSDAIKVNIALDSANGTRQADDALKAIRELTPSRGEWLVGGAEAYAYDTNQTYAGAIPWAVLIIAASMLVLMALLLASVVIPLQAIVINSLSLAISFAVIVGVFQLGWSNAWLHLGTVDGIVLTPLILIAAIAFGLAMDYSVFLYSRMYEVHQKTSDPTRAVREGIIKTGPIISAAAVMVFVVIVAFAGSSVMFMRIIGVGLGVAVLVDAFFVRLLMVPAIMTLMGRMSWAAPRWLKRLQIRHE